MNEKMSLYKSTSKSHLYLCHEQTKIYSNQQLFTFTASRQRKYFTIVYDYYSPLLYGFLVNAGLSEKYSSDILELTFIKMWNQETLPSGDICYCTWMIKIAIKTISKYLEY